MHLNRLFLISALLLGAHLPSSVSASPLPSALTVAEDGPQMNQPYQVTGINFGTWTTKSIPSSAFLSTAAKAFIFVQNATSAKLLDNGTTVLDYGWSETNQSGVMFMVEGTVLQDALNGKLGIDTNAESTITLTVTNCDNDYMPDISMLDMSNSKNRDFAIGLRAQISDLPTIYIDVDDISDGQDVNDVLFKQGNEAEYHDATIQVVDNTSADSPNHLETFTDRVKIKVRGNSTALENGKRPYRLKFGKDEKDANGKVIASHKHDMLGLGYSKRNWTLLTNHKDPSLQHNALTYYVGQLVGMPFCPGYKFVHLVINGDYRGCYQVSDHVEVGKNRININEDTGWFIESARQDMVEDPKINIPGDLDMTIKNPDSEDLTAEELATLITEVTDYFTGLSNVMKNYEDKDAFCDPQTGWRKYIDEESLVDFYVGINLTGDYDGFMTVKMYREADGKLKFGPLWDKDLAYGNWDADDGTVLCENQQAQAPLFSKYVQKLMTDPVFVRKVNNKFDAVIASGAKEELLTAVANMTAQLSNAWQINKSRWNMFQKTYPEYVKDLTDYITLRCTKLDKLLDDKYKEVCGGQSCTTHEYQLGAFAQQEDKTYRRVCDMCGAVDTEGEAYYKFTVYPQSKDYTETMTNDPEWPSKQDVSSKPNTLFFCEAEGLEGTNVISAGICESFVLTDGQKFTNPTKFSAKSATYVRSVSGETNWGTICVPFKIVESEEVKLYALNDVIIDGDNSKMTFVRATKTGGSTPLVFQKQEASAQSVTFLAGKQDNDLITVKVTSGIEKNTSSEIAAGWSFYGNVTKPQELSYETDPNMYYIAGNKFWHANTTLTINPFRAYFSGPEEARAAHFRISAEDEVNAIELIGDQEEEPNVYDLSGRKLQNVTGLKQGFFIIGQNKTIVQ